MHPVWQNPIQRTVRTAHLSVLMIVSHCTTVVYNTTQNSSDNLPSYLQTNTIAQMLSIRGEGAVSANSSTARLMPEAQVGAMPSTQLRLMTALVTSVSVNVSSVHSPLTSAVQRTATQLTCYCCTGTSTHCHTSTTQCSHHLQGRYLSYSTHLINAHNSLSATVLHSLSCFIHLPSIKLNMWQNATKC